MRNVPDVKTSTCGIKLGIFYDRTMRSPIADLLRGARAGRVGRDDAPVDCARYRVAAGRETAGCRRSQFIHADPPPEGVRNRLGRERRYLGFQGRGGSLWATPPAVDPFRGAAFRRGAS